MSASPLRLRISVTHMLDDIAPEAVADKDDRSARYRTFPDVADTAGEFLSAQRQACLRRVLLPPRVVVVEQDARVGHDRREHVGVLEPFDVEGGVFWVGRVLPRPRPVDVRAEAVDGDDAGDVSRWSEADSWERTRRWLRRSHTPPLGPGRCAGYAADR